MSLPVVDNAGQYVPLRDFQLVCAKFAFILNSRKPVFADALFIFFRICPPQMA